jgi:hypothetical protein
MYLDLSTLVHVTVFYPYALIEMSPRNTGTSFEMIPHSFPTAMAVSPLSPVAMMDFTLAALSVEIVPLVSSLRKFCMIKSPRNVKSHSACSLVSTISAGSF